MAMGFLFAITLLCVWSGSCVSDPVVGSGQGTESVAPPFGNVGVELLEDLTLIDVVKSYGKTIQNLLERVDNLEETRNKLHKADTRVNSNVKVAAPTKETLLNGINGNKDLPKIMKTGTTNTNVSTGPSNEGTKARGRRQSYEEPHVAFFAELDDNLTNMGPHQIVVFDIVRTNVGNAYHPSVGHFEAPVDGTYVFAFRLSAHTTAQAYFDLAVNGHAITPMSVEGDSSVGLFEECSQTLAIELSEGDEVSIRSRDTGGHLHGSQYSAFSGFLLLPRLSGNVVG